MSNSIAQKRNIRAEYSRDINLSSVYLWSTYPLETVRDSDTDPGTAWDIAQIRDVSNPHGVQRRNAAGLYCTAFECDNFLNSN